VPTGGFYVLYDEAAEEAKEREEEEEAKGRGKKGGGALRGPGKAEWR